MVVHGTKDKIALPESSQLIYDKSVLSSNKKIKLYEGYYHEVLNEPEKEVRNFFELSN